MNQIFQSKTVLRKIGLGAVLLLAGVPVTFSEPASHEWATVRDIAGKNEVWASYPGGRKVRLSVGDRVLMPCDIVTGKNSRVLLDFPQELVAVGENTRGSLTFPGEVKVSAGTAASETKKGAQHRPTIQDREGRLEARANRTMVILHAPPEGEGNTKALLVHGHASFQANIDGEERILEPGQMVVVPEQGEPYCVHIDLEIATKTSRLIQDFEDHWNQPEIQQAIASQRGRFVRGLPFGLRRGDGPEQRRLLVKPPEAHHRGH